MALYPGHLARLIRDALRPTPMLSESAVHLLLGTAAVESHMGTYLYQLPTGPALGIYQIEPTTYYWLRGRYGRKYDFFDASEERLVYDLRLSTLVARLRYWVDPEPLPYAYDIDALAHYWKRVYNTRLGKGNPSKFVERYRTLVLQPY